MWIFGNGLAADCVLFQASCSVEGVCLDDEYIEFSSPLRGHEVKPLSSIVNLTPPAELFIALGYKNLNRTRSEILSRVRKLGLPIGNVIAEPLLSNFSKFGVNNFIMQGANIQPYVSIDDNVFVWSGSTICHHVTIGSNVWLTAGSTIAGNTHLGSNIFVGANATIASGLLIGSNVFIGAGAIVTTDLPSGSVVVTKSTEKLSVSSDLFVKFLDSKGNY
jgi:serine acetyltransferase